MHTAILMNFKDTPLREEIETVGYRLYNTIPVTHSLKSSDESQNRGYSRWGVGERAVRLEGAGGNLLE